MIDQILGRPSPTVRRSEVFLVLFFWVWRLYKGDGRTISPMARHRRRNVTSGYNLTVAGRRDSAWWRRVWQGLFARGPGAMWTTRVNQRLSECSSVHPTIRWWRGSIVQEWRCDANSPERELYALPAHHRHVHVPLRVPASGRLVGIQW